MRSEHDERGVAERELTLLRCGARRHEADADKRAGAGTIDQGRHYLGQLRAVREGELLAYHRLVNPECAGETVTAVILGLKCGEVAGGREPRRKTLAQHDPLTFEVEGLLVQGTPSPDEHKMAGESGICGDDRRTGGLREPGLVPGANRWQPRTVEYGADVRITLRQQDFPLKPVQPVHRLRVLRQPAPGARSRGPAATRDRAGARRGRKSPPAPGPARQAVRTPPGAGPGRRDPDPDPGGSGRGS